MADLALSNGVMKLVAKIDEFGRLPIPEKLRAKLGLEPGMDVVFSFDQTSKTVEVTTRQLALRKAQVALAKYRKLGECWSEELIEERRQGLT